MKKTLLAVVTILLSSTLWAQKPVEVELHTEIKQFLSTYFPNDKYVSKEIDNEGLDITLESGAELDFDHAGKWEKIDMKKGTVPVGILPQKVANLLSKTGSTNLVREIEKKSSGAYEVTLKNGKEINIR